jgi:hypothetical protein
VPVVTPAPKAPFRCIRTATDEALLDQLDELVAAAAGGDRRAITAIAIAFGPSLLQEIRRELGPGLARDDGDVFQACLQAMTRRRLTFPRHHGAALPWLEETVRAFAQEHARSRKDRLAADHGAEDVVIEVLVDGQPYHPPPPRRRACSRARRSLEGERTSASSRAACSSRSRRARYASTSGRCTRT